MCGPQTEYITLSGSASKWLVCSCAAEKTGAKVVEDWICPSSDPSSSPRPHEDDPSAGQRAGAHAASAPAGGTPSARGVDAEGAGDGREGTSPLVGAYVGGTMAVLLTLIVATAVVSYYFAARS